MDILSFPNEVLSFILGHVGDTHAVSSVCKQFYAVECMRTATKTKLRITDDVLADKKIRDSIMRSGRVINELVVQSGAYRTVPFFTFLKKVLKQHGQNIIGASLFVETLVEEVELLEILNLMPNLVELNVTMDGILPARTSKRSKLGLNLNSLENLSIGESPTSVVQFLAKHMNNNIKVLTTRFDHDDVDGLAFTELIGKLQGVRHVCSMLDFSYLKYFVPLQLESLKIMSWANDPELNEDDSIDTAVLLLGQQNLLKLIIEDDIAVNDEVFQAISSINSLTFLSLSLDGISPGSIKNLCNLKHLEELRVYSDNIDPICALSHLKIETIHKLIIYGPEELGQQDGDRLVENFAGAEIIFYIQPQQQPVAAGEVQPAAEAEAGEIIFYIQPQDQVAAADEVQPAAEDVDQGPEEDEN